MFRYPDPGWSPLPPAPEVGLLPVLLAGLLTANPPGIPPIIIDPGRDIISPYLHTTGSDMCMLCLSLA